MIETQIVIYEGIVLSMPVVIAEEFNREFYGVSYDQFPDDCCGAGKGIGEKLVPDYAFGFTRIFSKLKLKSLDISIKLSPACWIHDEDWQRAAPTHEAFDISNERFRFNLDSIIQNKGKNDLVVAIGRHLPITYMNSVDLLGRYVFWSMKYSQGFVLPNDFLSFVNDEYVYKFNGMIDRKEIYIP